MRLTPELSVGAALLLGAGIVRAAEYPRTESHSGTSFFDGFRFPVEAYDNTTNGDVFWATPQNTSLLYVNDAGRVILKVDNTSLVPYNEKRYAPKLFSKSTYNPGTVWVMDAVHVPYGCSVWGAFWTQGPNWPTGGEIDIFEGIHMRKQNMMALHTNGTVAECKIDRSKSMSGRIDSEDCNQDVNNGSGCTVFDNNEQSYGEAFSQAGGGVYVTEWSTDAIRIWFIARSAVPSSLTLTAENIDTSTLGTPVAEYSSSTCDIEKLFLPQTLTINIVLCGDFASLPALLEETCPALVGDKTCYTTYVIDDASATYANAYFELNYINVYSTNSSGSASGSGSSTMTLTDGMGKATTTVTAGVGTHTNGTANGGGSSDAAKTVQRGMIGALMMGSVGLVAGLRVL
ncbi:endo-1,3(4)-beta-glucanase [Kwoniella heveanensis CBS 569]|nr:endo-1,3(4)-beta-glucanase [Kwoniella heveanensis CBS 569]